jgi:hypothetical protein
MNTENQREKEKDPAWVYAKVVEGQRYFKCAFPACVFMCFSFGMIE